MKKALILMAMTMAASQAVAGSYEFGTVSEFVVNPDRVTFQLNSANGSYMPDGCLDGGVVSGEKELNWVIPNSYPMAKQMFDTILKAKETGTTVGINGAGNCMGEFEEVDSIALNNIVR